MSKVSDAPTPSDRPHVGDIQSGEETDVPTPLPVSEVHLRPTGAIEQDTTLSVDVESTVVTPFRDPYQAAPESVYERYHVTVDHNEGDRATEIRLFQFHRPHMRGFHVAWISFFLAFMIWFSPAPLLKEIQKSLNLTKKEIWTSSITNDLTAIVLRILVGPLCDAYGARRPMAAVLIVASIPTACVGLIESAAGLAITRFFIGIAGSSFVMSQFWPSRMFARELSGTANGMVGGWGNLGGAFAQLMMGAVLFPAFRDRYEEEGEENPAELAWRIVCVIPAAVALCWGIMVPFISDDAPMGNYREMRRRGAMDTIFMTTALRSGALMNTWILCMQYACSFGVELVMNNAAVLYFVDEFGLSTEDAAALGFIYGSMNLFARGIGGLLSDKLNLKFGMRGRLWLTTVLLIMEGGVILIFPFVNNLVFAVLTMCTFSIFTQAAEGAIFGVVPYVTKLYSGSVSGWVGAGGNVGSVLFGFGFRSLSYRDAFTMMGCLVIASSALSAWINIPLYAGLLSGKDNHTVIKARQRFLERKARERELRERIAAGHAIAEVLGTQEQEDPAEAGPETATDPEPAEE